MGDPAPHLGHLLVFLAGHRPRFIAGQLLSADGEPRIQVVLKPLAGGPVTGLVLDEPAPGFGTSRP